MTKYFHKFLGVSVLSALLVLPAMALDVSTVSDLTTGWQNGTDMAATGNISGINSVVSANNKNFSLNLGGHTLSGAASGTTGLEITNGTSLILTGGGTISGLNRPDTDPSSVHGSEYGAVNVGQGSTLMITDGDWSFSGNTGGLGAINSLNGSVLAGVNTITFSNNVTSSQGGGLRHDNTSLNDTTVARIVANTITFSGNHFADGATVGGGAGVMNSRGTLELLGATNIFTGNNMNATIASGRQYKVGGGAIANQSGETKSGGVQTGVFDATMVIGKEDGSSINTFTNNTSSTSGGAIMNRAVDTDGNAYLTINGTTTFTGNEATINGGAIYNVGMGYEIEGPDGWSLARRNSVTITGGSTFDSNKAGSRGGAIYNAGDMAIDSAIFTSNTTTSDHAGFYASQGGAIYNAGADDLANDFTSNGLLTINGATFGIKGDNTKGNSAVQGGAIANSADETGFGYIGEITLNNTNFYYNKARADSDASDGYSTSAGGAIWNDDGNIVINGDTEFIGNAATGYAAMGGAIRNGYGDIVFNKKANFDSNNAERIIAGNGAQGGAINNEGTITFKNLASFTENTAFNTVGQTSGLTYLSKGGAIYNESYGMPAAIAFEQGAAFEENSADLGGAIFNADGVISLTDALFEDNIANNDGGAIFNGGTIELSGTNVFTGNKVGNFANDIYNYGNVNIKSGTTSMDGGITGDTGILNIADNATLKLGTASITQNTITLNGDMFATLNTKVDDISTDTSVAQINAQTFVGDGNLTLTMAETGTYHVFGGSDFDIESDMPWTIANADTGVSFTNSKVYDLTWNGGYVTAEKKSVEDIAKESEIAVDSATVISGVIDSASNSSSQQMKDLSVRLQEKLAEGDTESVEHATKAINPEKESVAQAVASSVQNTVIGLASARMSLPAVGRNGGDVRMTSAGAWVQGLYNRTKQADAFNGYTRGVAAGLDGTINKHWTIGAGYSFTHSDIVGSARDTDIDSNTVFLYGQYKPSEWYLNAVANYTMSNYSEHGTVIDNTFVTSDYKVRSFGANVATGYDFASGITPELGLRYMHISTDDYANSYGIKTHMDNTNYLTGLLGAKYVFNVVASEHTMFMPQLNAGFKYDLVSDGNVATVTMPGISAYSLEGSRLSRAGGEFGVGLGMRHRNLDIYLNYDIDVRKDYTSQTGMLKFRCNF